MYQHDWRSGMKTGFAYVCPWIVTVINNKNKVAALLDYAPKA